jgi:hypothetical protein
MGENAPSRDSRFEGERIRMLHLQAFLQGECIMLILAQMQNPCHSLLQIIIIYSNTGNLKEEFSLTQTHSSYSYHANIKPP